MARQGTEITRDNLLNATHDLFVERGGRSASVSEICERAGVSVAMVKYHFGNKDGLLDALLERALHGVAAQIERLAARAIAPEEKLRRHVAEIVRNYVRYPYINRLMNEQLLSADPDAVDRISRAYARPARGWYATLLADGRREHGWKETDPTLFFFSVVGVCEFIFSAGPLLERSFQQRLDAALVERYIEHVTDLVHAGLVSKTD